MALKLSHATSFRMSAFSNFVVQQANAFIFNKSLIVQNFLFSLSRLEQWTQVLVKVSLSLVNGAFGAIGATHCRHWRHSLSPLAPMAPNAPFTKLNDTFTQVFIVRNISRTMKV